MANDKATLNIGDKSWDFSVRQASVGPDIIDITSLYKDTGAFTFDPGFTSTASCESDITFIDGDEGVLLHRGYAIDELADKGDFLDTCYLLLYGELPNKADGDEFRQRVTMHTMVHEQMNKFYTGFRRDAHPMAIMCGVVGALSAFYHDSTDISDEKQRMVASMRMIAKMPTLAAMAHKYHIGQPFVFSFAQAGNNCGLAAVNAFASVGSFCVWMTKNDFQVYDGAVRQQTCDVQDYVFGDLNRTQISKVVAGVNSANDEIWWFYPSADSEENDRYVAWNFREDHWAIGTLARTAWCDSTIRRTPTAAGTDNYLYDHEQGYTNNGAALMATRYAQSGSVEIATGERAIVARQVIPDEGTQGQTKLVFKTRMTPNGSESSHGPYSMTDYTDVRFTGRQFALRVEGNADADWRFGTPRLEAVPGSKR